MPSGAQRFAQQQLARQAAKLPDWPLAKVTAITTGGGTDSQDLVTVSYLGASLKLPHMAHYTPVVGHVVVLQRAGGNWHVFGRLVGFPA